MPTILIIDDDPDIVKSMKVVLESRKYQVFSASNGKEGLQKTKEVKPDVIILDIIMETGDEGFDVAREIRKDQNFKNIPILMLTSIKERTGFDFKKEAGDEVWLPVDDYCEKPLKPKELIEKVDALLKRSR